MPDKFQLVSYLVGLENLMVSMEKSGTRGRSYTLGHEYQLCYAQLKQMLQKEHHEARTQFLRDHPDEARALGEGGKPEPSL